ncbi:MAG: PLP-dependent aminotransferase family protein [Dehalococcoidales bacterium]|nr:MAG: PLP-dependent aminotransferase family protein [Dehalococcoidales bacterium]
MNSNGSPDSGMSGIFSDRISDVPRSFIREILKVTLDRTVISFAGGLPNRDLFPVEELKEAAVKVMETYGSDIFQYGNSEGHPGLREMISHRYREKRNLDIPVEDILITNGAQQGLDLLGKIYVNEGDPMIIEEPGYLGAIQAFSIFRPEFHPVPVSDEGMDIDKLRSVMSCRRPKLIYTVPNFQNPSGISYSEENRRQITGILEGTPTLLIEDDPYVDLRYSGESLLSFKTYLPDNAILLGSFSKTVVPGFRLGWIAARGDIMDKLIIAKQASDLHTNQFVQYVIYRYLQDNDIDLHITKIKKAYGEQLRTMAECIDEYFPSGTSRTHPRGGMFIWAELPEGLSARNLLDRTIQEKVIFVPGDPFYVNRRDANTMRLNFSCTGKEVIRDGIARLGKAIEIVLNDI